MKRVLLLLFLGSSVVPPLVAEVVYHLVVLVDSDLSDSVALVNLFPGNSSISVGSPDFERREVFTVQQRSGIGRNIALPPSAASRLGLSAQSIAEVRLVELGADGNNLEGNPATEYRDIVASPVGTEETFSRPSAINPALSPLASVPLTSSPATSPVNGGELEAPSVSGLPPSTEPAPRAKDDSMNNSLVINADEKRLRIPLPTSDTELKPQNPSPQTIAGGMGNSSPQAAPSISRNRPIPNAELKPQNPSPQTIGMAPSQEKLEEEKSLLTTQLPAGDPFAARNPDRVERELPDTAPPPSQAESEIEKINTIYPAANLNASRLATEQPAEPPAEQTSDKPQPAEPPEQPAEPTETIIPMGDARPTSSSTAVIKAPKESESAEASKLASIPRRPEIYFPTEGDLNPPPDSKSSEKLSESDVTAANPFAKPEAPLPEKPIAPLAQSPPPPPISRPVAARVIGNLNNLDLPAGYYIQLASFRDVRKTRQVYEQFVNEYKMNVVPALINGRKYYRCLIGNIDESEVAEILRKVRAAGYQDAFVYRNN